MVVEMEKLRRELSGFLSDRLYQIIISNPRKGGDAFKIKIRPVMVKGMLRFQETVWRGTQVFHENYEKERMEERAISLMMSDFGQLEAQSMDGRLLALVSKKGRVTVKRQSGSTQSSPLPELSHNRAKQYLLREGECVPFLVDLGVQTREGQIVRSRYDKFRQINRYLEFVEDILPTLKKKGPVRIIDFGCGKSYLTFALYYFLHEQREMDVEITGLDLKTSVIKKCNELAEKYGYKNLRFYQGDISTFQGMEQVDMVVSLHACDTATDHAIWKALGWKARVIFAVPCCQHEVNGQIQSEMFGPVLKYGLLKERMAALVTDGIRAGLLEEMGYETQVLEFIDMEHTPKNILIRAVRREEGCCGRGDMGRACTGAEEKKRIQKSAIDQMAQALGVETTLQRLMRGDGQSGQ